jgi:hypothetical protein
MCATSRRRFHPRHEVRSLGPIEPPPAPPLPRQSDYSFTTYLSTRSIPTVIIANRQQRKIDLRELPLRSLKFRTPFLTEFLPQTMRRGASVATHPVALREGGSFKPFVGRLADGLQGVFVR